MNLKREARKIVEENGRWIHELAVEGEFDSPKFDPRKGWMVTLTYAKYGEVFQGVGTSFFNPEDKSYSSVTGYEIARGNAECALGAQMLWAFSQEDFTSEVPSYRRVVRLILDSAHRVTGDCKWKEMTKPASMRPYSKKAKSRRLLQALSSGVTWFLNERANALVVNATVTPKPFSDNGGTSKLTQDAPCAEPKEQQTKCGSVLETASTSTSIASTS